MCEGSFLPSSFGPHQKHTEFESSLRSYPINPSRCSKGGQHGSSVTAPFSACILHFPGAQPTAPVLWRRIFAFHHIELYQRRPLLASADRRNLFLEILERVRRRYAFVVVGYVVMPEHFHLLISEPERGNPSTVMQVLKQRFARAVLRECRRRKPAAHGTFWNEA